MVLSNKKLKQKLRAELAQYLTNSVAGYDSNPLEPPNPNPNSQSQGSLRKLLDSATGKPSLSKREKRRKSNPLQGSERANGGASVEEDKDKCELGEEEKMKKHKKKKENEGLSSEGNWVVEEAKKSKKKKKKHPQKKKKKKEKGEGEEVKRDEDTDVGLGGEKPVLIELIDKTNSEQNGEIPTKVYVGGIPYYSSEDDIRSYFESCGTITEVDCMTFPESGKFRGIAIISFKTEAAAKRALALDGADMGGLFLKIQPYKTNKANKASEFAPEIVEGYNRIYAGNLSWDITEDELKILFSGCNISSIRFGMDKETGEFRGYAHVDFSDKQSLTRALKFDQKIVCGRPVRISCAVPLRKTGEKQLNNVPANKASDTAKEANSSNVNMSSGKIKRRTCYECGEKGHLSSACPKKQTADPTISGAS